MIDSSGAIRLMPPLISGDFVFVIGKLVLGGLVLIGLPGQVLADKEVWSCKQGWDQNLYYIIDAEDTASVSNFFGNHLQMDVAENPQIKDHVEHQYIEEEFFDTDELALYAADAGLSIQTRRHLSKYNRERRKVVLNIPRHPAYTGGIEFQTRVYNRQLNPMARHPLLGIVKRSERKILLDNLARLNVAPVTELAPSLQVIHKNIRYSLREFNRPYVQMIIGQATISALGITAGLTSIRFEVLQPAVATLKEHARNNLKDALTQAHCNFQTEFPRLRPSPGPNYRHYYQAVSQKFPSLPWFRKYPLIFSAGQALLLASIGALPLYLVINRRKPDQARVGYRLLSKRTNLGDGRV